MANNTIPGKKFYIKVPIEQKDEVKKLGARYDCVERLWYYTNPSDAPKFKKWQRADPLVLKKNPQEWERELEKRAWQEPEQYYKVKYHLARAYYGKGEEDFPKDMQKAFFWMDKAAKAMEGLNFKCNFVYLYLGEMYQYGNGTEVNIGQAIRLYEKGLSRYQTNEDIPENLTSVIAYYMGVLGYLYNEDRGGHRDDKKSNEWLERASRLGNLEANYRLAAHYYYGQGVERNLKRSKELLQKAVREGNPRSRCTQLSREKLNAWFPEDVAS